MKTKMFLTIVVAVLMSTAASARAPQWKNADYDAVRDFTTTSNPNGVWSYGWESSLGGALNLYTVADTNCYPGYGIGEWHEEGSCYPFVLHNDTDKHCVLQACFPPTYLGLHPGQSGELSVVRWTAPSSGRFMIEGTFTGLDWSGPTSTDIHVLVNSKKSLLSGPITSYKWPLTFNLTVRVSVGDTVDFAVGFGKDGNHGYDSTGVRFAVTRLGKN